MLSDEKLVYGDVVRRKGSGTTVMVIEPKLKRGRGETGWFTGMLINTESKNPFITRNIGEIGNYQRRDVERVE